MSITKNKSKIYTTLDEFKEATPLLDHDDPDYVVAKFKGIKPLIILQIPEVKTILKLKKSVAPNMTDDEEIEKKLEEELESGVFEPFFTFLTECCIAPSKKDFRSIIEKRVQSVGPLIESVMELHNNSVEIVKTDVKKNSKS